MGQSQVQNTITGSSEGKKIISSVAMIVTLVSFGMLFATLMMGFALFRFTAPIWPPAGMTKPSLFLPSISTLFIFISSLSYFYFENKFNEGREEKTGLVITMISGLAFMVSQFLFWNELKSHGVFVSSGIFASIIYAFTWIHAAHIVAGLGLLFWLYVTFNGQRSDLSLKISNVGKFWHFLGIVWIIMFVTIFVL